MAVDGDFANFRAVYDELTDVIDGSRFQFLPGHLANWFRTLDTTTRVGAIIKRLESGADYPKWRQNLVSNVGSYIQWPAEP
jgi:hypothetical protein